MSSPEMQQPSRHQENQPISKTSNSRSSTADTRRSSTNQSNDMSSTDITDVISIRPIQWEKLILQAKSTSAKLVCRANPGLKYTVLCNRIYHWDQDEKDHACKKLPRRNLKRKIEQIGEIDEFAPGQISLSDPKFGSNVDRLSISQLVNQPINQSRNISSCQNHTGESVESREIYQPHEHDARPLSKLSTTQSHNISPSSFHSSHLRQSSLPIIQSHADCAPDMHSYSSIHSSSSPFDHNDQSDVDPSNHLSSTSSAVILPTGDLRQSLIAAIDEWEATAISGIRAQAARQRAEVGL